MTGPDHDAHAGGLQSIRQTLRSLGAARAIERLLFGRSSHHFLGALKRPIHHPTKINTQHDRDPDQCFQVWASESSLDAADGGMRETRLGGERVHGHSLTLALLSKECDHLRRDGFAVIEVHRLRALPRICVDAACANWHNRSMIFLRRLGPDPHAAGARSVGGSGCPDIFELDSGDFAVIGINITDGARAALPPTASCGPDESIVRVPRRTLVLARPDIPENL